MSNFIELCKSNDIEYIKKEYKNNKKVFEYKKLYTFEFENAFRFACSNEHLDFAKWLLEIKPDINISVNNEYSFRVAYSYGHLDVAK